MIRKFFVFVILLMPLVVTSCGTLQVGVEAAPSVAAPSTAEPATVAPTTSGPVPTARPAATPSRSPTPPANTPRPLPPPVRITFSPGSTLYTLTANLTPNEPQTFILAIQSNQQLLVTASNGANITVLDGQGNPVKPSTGGSGQWHGRVPATADYTIILRGSGESFVTISIPPPGA